jgi:hypothetical protein
MRIQVIAKYAGSETLILHLWLPYSTATYFDTADFYTEKRVRKPSFRPNLVLNHHPVTLSN